MSCKTGVQDLVQGETRAGIKVVALGPVDSLEARFNTNRYIDVMLAHVVQVYEWFTLRRVHGHCHLQRAPPGKVDKASPKIKANLKTLLWPGMFEYLSEC